MLRCLLTWLVLLSTALARPAARPNAVPKVGEKFVVPPKSNDSGVCMVSPGQMDKCVTATIGGIEYTIAYRAKSNAKGRPVVTYVHTTDPKFLSLSGHRIGDVLEVRYGQTIRAPGFEIYADTAVGGWAAVVGFNGKVTKSSSDEEIELDSLKDSLEPLRLRITGFSAR